jgi:Holliday junction resolvasome RuvABC endonuclease subunit
MLLALDLGTKTGWAVSSNAGITYGMQEFKNDRFSGGGMRFLKFEKWLMGLPKPAQVVFEEVRRHAATDAAHVYGGLMAVVTKWCEAEGIPYQGVPVGTIKKYWAGKGNAKKDVMIAEAKKRGYKDVEDDNTADALALLHYWLSEGMVDKSNSSLENMLN